MLGSIDRWHLNLVFKVGFKLEFYGRQDPALNSMEGPTGLIWQDPLLPLAIAHESPVLTIHASNSKTVHSDQSFKVLFNRTN